MKFLKGPVFAVLCILLILLTNLRHAVSVYSHITNSTIDGWSFELAYIIGMMLAIDFAVIAFSVNGNKPAAIVFAIAIGLINLFFYFSKIGLPEAWINPECSECPPGYMVWILYFPAVIMSSLAGYAIYYFNEIFIKNIEWESYMEGLKIEAANWQEKYQTYQQQQKEANKHLSLELERQKGLTFNLLSWISDQQKYEEIKINTLRKRRSRAKERLLTELSEAEKLRTQLEILSIDHHLDERKSMERSSLNGLEIS